MLYEGDDILIAGDAAPFAVPLDARLFCPNAVVRIVARLRSRSLDVALRDGADPADSPQLAFHARRLVSPPARLIVASALERLAGAREEPGRFHVRPFPDAVRANADQLLALAQQLRDPSPVYAQGVATLRWIVSDGTGPAYADRTGECLRRELDVAALALGN